MPCPFQWFSCFSRVFPVQFGKERMRFVHFSPCCRDVKQLSLSGPLSAIHLYGVKSLCFCFSWKTSMKNKRWLQIEEARNWKVISSTGICSVLRLCEVMRLPRLMWMSFIMQEFYQKQSATLVSIYVQSNGILKWQGNSQKTPRRAAAFRWSKINSHDYLEAKW